MDSDVSRPDGHARRLVVVGDTPSRTREDLADELESLRDRLVAGEKDQRRGAEELAHIRHQIGLVRAQLRNATIDGHDVRTSGSQRED